MTDWMALLNDVQVSETAARVNSDPVDVPDILVGMLAKLRAPGPNGGKQRASLPAKGNAEYLNMRRVLSAAAKKLDPPASVSAKPVFSADDEESVPNTNGPGMQVKIRDGAQPIRISFTVGERRGAKPNGPEEAPIQGPALPPEPRTEEDSVTSGDHTEPAAPEKAAALHVVAPEKTEPEKTPPVKPHATSRGKR